MRSANRRHRLLPAPLLALAMLFSTLSFVALTATPAFADQWGVSPGTGGGGTGGGGTGGGGGGGGDGTGGGGTGGGGGGGGGDGDGFHNPYSDSGQGFFPSRPPAKVGGTGGSYTDYSNTYHYGGRCDGNATWTNSKGTFSAPHIGWRWWVVGTYVSPHTSLPGQEEEGFQRQINVTGGGYSCIDPPHYYDEEVICAAYGDGVLKGPMKNPNASTQTKNFGPTKTPFYANGMTNPATCKRNYQFPINVSPKRWGQYRLTGTAYAVRCTQRVYYTKDERTGRIPATEMRGCGPTYPADRDQVDFELFCKAPYARLGWSNNMTFTSDDCQAVNGGGEWMCGPSGSPSFSGVATGNEIAILDDAKRHKVTWAQPKPQGALRNVRDKTTRLLFRKGSPFRLGQPATAKNQPFQTNPGLNKWQQGWQVEANQSSRSAWQMAFMAPGLPGKPWTARPEWKFTADFRVMVPKLQWNIGTGSLTWTLTETWRPEIGVCQGRDVEVNVHRARSTTN